MKRVEGLVKGKSGGLLEAVGDVVFGKITASCGIIFAKVFCEARCDFSGGV